MNLIMIKYFQQWIKDYQQQLVPAHLSGLMRVGYWDNKVTRVMGDDDDDDDGDDDDDDEGGGLLGQQGDRVMGDLTSV